MHSNTRRAKTPHSDADMYNSMHVTKRNKLLETMRFDKIVNRLKRLCDEANLKQVNYIKLAMKVFDQLFDKITTTKINELCAEQCASLSSVNVDYNLLAGRIVVNNLHKTTSKSFTSVMKQLYQYHDKNNKRCPLVSTELWDFVSHHRDFCDGLIDYNRDYLLDYFGLKTLERAYLMKINGVIVERPQHMWLRVAIGIHGDQLELIKETYDLMSTKKFTMATPTLFNAGTSFAQLSSCFLIAMEDDSIDGIFNTVKDCATISKWAGGIGLHVHNVRARGSLIRSTNGTSNGIGPMLRVFNNTAKYVDQGGNKRAGSFAIYLEPWHADVETFLQLRTNHGDEGAKARDLFYALWIPDLFMERIKAAESWTLMCPDECPGLSDVYGAEFVELYTKYEREGRGRATIPARDLWFKILDAQQETGTPFLCYKDAANKKSNQQNIGVIKSSNLCTEIMQVSTSEETAVCNLGSLSLPAFVTTNENGIVSYDYEELHRVAKVLTRNLNAIIDRNFYPTEKARRSNTRHRPVGLGVQGLADVFLKMNLAFTSEQARDTNRLIFETIYHAALETSMELAKEHSAYETFAGSPASRGVLQYDLWDVTPTPERYDWDGLKRDIQQYGLRNSLLTAVLPTASTSQILGNTECIEPVTSNIFSRTTAAGQFVVVNQYLMRDLMELGVWNEALKNNIIANNGSIQHLDFLCPKLREKYATVWEIPMKCLMDMAIDRGAYICQSQSLNLFAIEPSYNILTKMFFYGWSHGLKTGCYYLRRRGVHKAQQFTIEPEAADEGDTRTNLLLEEEEAPESCLMCSA